jgi:hypothetical protein
MKPIVHQIQDSTNYRSGRIIKTNSFYSEWSEDFKLISLKVNGREAVKDGELDKSNFWYSIAKTSKFRHLKKLKLKLGVAEVVEKKMKRVLVREYSDWPFSLKEIEEGAKMVGGQRITSVVIYDLTEDNKKLALEYNELHKQIEELKDKQHKLKNQMK